MTIMRNFWESIARAPDDGTAAAPADAAPAPAADAAPPADAPPIESVLFPSEGKKPAGDPAAAAPEWKEYEADPSKSEADNAKAKAEHDAKKPADPNDPANKVPEDGKYDLKMPEGIEVDSELLGALGPEFKDLGLTNAQAQKLADRFIDIQKQRGEASSKSWAETQQKWVADAKADKEIGGGSWDKNVTVARRAMEQFGTPELREYMNASGGGNHPEVIRLLVKVGNAISDDTPPNGGSPGSGKPVDAAHLLFPNDKPKG